MISRIARLVVVASLIFSTAYGRTFPLTASAAVPAAKGKVETGKDKNGNTEVKLETEHLAEPDKLTPSKTVYLIWFQETGGEPVMQGQLRIDKHLKGTFKTTTPLKNFAIFVTGESDPNTKTPTGTEVLRTVVQQ
jgi:hypothetical protein